MAYKAGSGPRIELKFKSAIRAAETRELDWDLDLETYISIATQECHYCSKTAVSRWGSGLDRIDNDEGYFLENVLPCCGPCNRIRGDNLTVDEMEVAMEAVMSFRKNSR